MKTDDTHIPFQSRWSATWVALCLAAAVMLVHHPMLLSGLAIMQVNPGDTRFNNYCLEHSYLWMAGAEHHERFWDPPFFYPARNVAAFGDLLVGLGPLYWPWRMAGLAPDTAFQLWMMGATTLNFLAVYFFLRGVTRVGAHVAGVAAVFFASANSLVAQLGHQQVYCQVYVLGAFYSVFKMFSPRPDPEAAAKRTRWVPVASFFACLVLQLHTNFYLGFFVLLILGLALLYSLAVRENRRHLVSFLRSNVAPMMVCGSVAILAMIPWGEHYLAVAASGQRSLDEVKPMIPRLQSWIYMGPPNRVYGWTAGWEMFRTLRMEHEHQLGFGLVTALASAAGLFLRRRSAGIKTVVATAVLLFLMTTKFNVPGLPSAWELVYFFVPGGNAVRSVTRIGMLLLIPAAIGLAFFLDHLLGKRTAVFRGLAILVGVVCLAEQFAETPVYDKQEVRKEVNRIARQIRPDCRAFFYTQKRPETILSWQTHLDAMWAGLAAGKPTVNGYSGNTPGKWRFDNIASDTRHSQEKNSESLRRWLDASGLEARDVQWIGRQEFGPALPVAVPLNTELKASEKPGIGLLGNGWSWAEPEGVWSDGALAELVFSAPPEIASKSRCRLVLTLHAFVLTPQHAQCFEMFLNGDPVGRHSVANSRLRSILLELKAAQLKPVNRLQFRLRSPFSPASVGDGHDERVLGIFLHSVNLVASDKSEPSW